MNEPAEPVKPSALGYYAFIAWLVVMAGVGVAVVVTHMMKPGKATKPPARVDDQPRKPADPVAELAAFGGPSALDVAAYLGRAHQHARELADDAQLVRIDLAAVGPDGRANLTAVRGTSELYRFRSPSRSRPPFGAPKPKSLPCAENVLALPVDGATWYTVPSYAPECVEPLVAPPRCTPAMVWAMSGAPAKGVARFSYFADPDTASFVGADMLAPGHWTMAIGGDSYGNDPTFSREFPDSCAEAPDPTLK